MPLPSRPHFSFPFTRTTTGVQSCEQDSEQHIMAQANMVTYCPLGYRPERPEFGWPWPDLVMIPVDPQPLLNALKNFLPDTAEISLAQAALLADGVFEIDVNIGVSSADTTGVSQEDD